MSNELQDDDMPNGFRYSQLFLLDEKHLKDKMNILLEDLSYSITSKRAYILMIISLKRSISIHGDNQRLRAELDENINTPWPLYSVVQELVKATDILLDTHNYDGHGYEVIHEARKHAKIKLDECKGVVR